MIFQLSGMVVNLHLNNSIAIAYLCKQGGTRSLFVSRLACHISNLAEKHGITFILVYTDPFQCGNQLPFIGKVGSRVPSAALHSLGCISSSGSTGG